MQTNTIRKLHRMSVCGEGVGVGMLYEVQNRNVFSLRLKVCVLLVWRTLSERVFQTLGATLLTTRSHNLSLDRDTT